MRYLTGNHICGTQLITDNFSKQGRTDEARNAFKDIVTKNLDWPEAIFEAWISFEHLYGSVEEIEECLDKVERAQNQLNARRLRVCAEVMHM